MRSTVPEGCFLNEWLGNGGAARRSRRSPPRPTRRAGSRFCGPRGAGQTLLDQALDFIEMTLERNKATIVRQVSQKAWRWMPKWVDDMIAAKVVNGLSETLREMRDPEHPWREDRRTR